MKTLNDAAKKVSKAREYWSANKDLADQIATDPEILSCLLTIATQERPNVTMAQKLLQAIICGIAIGMEMEKP